MSSMCSELTPRARIPDTRIPQLMQPCHCPSWFIGKFSHTCFHHTPKAANEMLETVTKKNFYNGDGDNDTCDDDNFGRPATENA